MYNKNDKRRLYWLIKMYLFLESSLPKNSTIIKNDSLYNIFKDGFSIKIDTLKSEGIDKNFSFFSLDAENGIKYIPLANKNSELLIDFPYSYTTKYVLCINIDLGKSYRIMGFDGNDLLNFIFDYRKYFIYDSPLQIKKL